MEASIESLGFVHFWGFSPAINVFRGIEKESLRNLDLSDKEVSINILLSETSDVRHVLKSISDSIEEASHEDIQAINPEKEINVSLTQL